MLLLLRNGVKYMKTFTVAGVSKLNGQFKARFANDITRVKVLDKNGHTDINLIELPYAMDKPDAVDHLLTLPAFSTDTAIIAAMHAVLGNPMPKAAAAPAAAVEEAATVEDTVEEAAKDGDEQVSDTVAEDEPVVNTEVDDKIIELPAAKPKRKSKAAQQMEDWAAAADAEDAQLEAENAAAEEAGEIAA